VFGTDEVGYGPVLGPLVVGVAAFRIPERSGGSAAVDASPDRFEKGGILDLWSLLRRSVSARRGKGARRRIHVDDSKRVHDPARGVGPLETSALAIWIAADASRDPSSPSCPPTSTEILRDLALGSLRGVEEEPWCEPLACALPLAADSTCVGIGARGLRADLRRTGVELASLRVRVVEGAEYNARVTRLGSKGALLGEVHAEVARHAFGLARPGETAVWLGDVHGGRLDYGAILASSGGAPLWSRASRPGHGSDYQARAADGSVRAARFVPRGDSRFFPVAVASIVAKYAREIRMAALNEYFRERLPGLRPTAGYFGDGRRFLRDLAPLLSARPEWRRTLIRVR
jgi:hypothetical protein